MVRPKKRSRVPVIGICVLLIALGAAVIAGAQNEETPSTRIAVITIDGSINPGSADYIISSIHSTAAEGYEALIIELDTPGGLVESTRDIVQVLLSSPLPVVVYVTPPGAHAGSAGVMITMAADVAAMAPGTNIGAASPVSGTGEMDETMKNKVTNDVAAWVEGIAEQRGRNEEWAINAVREAVSVTATKAKKLNVIDLVAETLDDLVAKIDGKKVTIGGEERVLQTGNAKVVRLEMSLKHRLISKLADPNLAYIFMIIGMIGIYAEFSNPGLILPGVVGGICLVLFLMATQILPINSVALILIAAGLVLFILEIKFTSYGLLTAGGLACLTIGSWLLFDVPEKVVDPTTFSLKVSWSYIIPSVITLGTFVLGATYLVVRAHRRKPETGNEGIVGRTGKAITEIAPGAPGRIQVLGETWKADCDEPIAVGDLVTVVEASKSSLALKVKKNNGSTQVSAS
jgi:membrane-bound serine protease (ClpP class)